MIPDFAQNDPLLNYLFAGGIFALFLLVAGSLRIVFRFALRKQDQQSKDRLASQALRAVRNSTVLFVVLLGLFVTLMLLPILEPWRGMIGKIWAILVVLQTAYIITNVTKVTANWYLYQVAPRTSTTFDDKMVPMMRRIVLVATYGIAGLVALDLFGISISPLLGGLGITGLAVALALQPTLSNFFAGTYVLSDGAIGVGDYIELQGGPSGYVIEVGWRSTKMRTWLNNLVVVPNSVLADTIVINYQAPDPEMNILVTCGVSYESDLEQVERVSLEVAQEVLDHCPGAVRDMEPWFGYDRFGESNIEFWVFIQAEDRIASFVVTNELIKSLHARFRVEGIHINYPVRKLIYGDKGAEMSNP